MFRATRNTTVPPIELAPIAPPGGVQQLPRDGGIAGHHDQIEKIADPRRSARRIVNGTRLDDHSMPCE
jgi:hypothetical protein